MEKVRARCALWTQTSPRLGDSSLLWLVSSADRASAHTTQLNPTGGSTLHAPCQASNRCRGVWVSLTACVQVGIYVCALFGRWEMLTCDRGRRINTDTHTLGVATRCLPVNRRGVRPASESTSRCFYCSGRAAEPRRAVLCPARRSTRSGARFRARSFGRRAATMCTNFPSFRR